jgi:hypothetical protein
MLKFKILISPYFLGFLGLYFFIRSLDFFKIIHIDFLANHLADVCAMPVVLTICLLCLRLIKKDAVVILPFWFIIMMTVYWSAYFEWWLPYYSDVYTADVLDVLAYVIGGASFYFWQKWMQKTNKQTPLIEVE